MPYQLENNQLRLRFDESSGAINSVLHKKSRLEFIAEPRLAASFKLLVPLPELRHNYLLGSQQKLLRFESSKNSCSLTWDNLQNDSGKFEIALKQTFELGPEENEIQVTTFLQNASKFTIEEIWSPIFGGFHGIRDRKRTEFSTALWDGAGPPNFGRNGFDRFPSNFPYWNEYYDYFELAYPWEQTMQWVDFSNTKT